MKVYSIVEMQIHNEADFEEYTKEIRSQVSIYGGRSLRCRPGSLQLIYGEDSAPLNHIAVLEWDRVGAAEGYFKSDDVNRLRDKYKNTVKLIRVYVVETLW
jgi:uncharacterized protein (DUF1330 family)